MLKFQTPVSIAFIKDLLADQEVPSTYCGTGMDIIKGISDGRFPVKGTICFVEKEPPAAVEEVLYIYSEFLEGVSVLQVHDPRLAFIKLLQRVKILGLTKDPRLSKEKLIDETALVSDTAVIEDGVIIGANTVISSGCVIKSGTVIGPKCILRENIVIGGDGIALYKSKGGATLRFPHLGGVEVGSGVEIGAGCVIAQGTLSPTTIGNDVVIGSMSNIGHGVTVSDKVWISVGVLIGGNSKISQYATIGMGVVIKDNIHVAELSSVGMGSVVTKATESGKSYFGTPAIMVRGVKSGPIR